MADSVEKVGVSTGPIFSAPSVRFSNADAGGLIIPSDYTWGFFNSIGQKQTFAL
jgi:hypothetical protein